MFISFYVSVLIKVNIKMKQVNVVRIGEPFLLLCDIRNETPYALKFKNSNLEMVKLVFYLK